MKKKLPIGLQTFRNLILEGYYYVDKTPYVCQLAAESKYYFLSRPRRFGKSLFLSTLKSAFSGERELFKGLYLENHWDWTVRYPVIYISFGSGVFHDLDILRQRQQEILIDNARALGVSMTHQTITGQFQELILKACERYKQPVVILIDEYDKPILDNIDDADIAQQIREGLKNFYSVIKDSDPYIRLVFLTGVTKFSKVSLFSGLNNLEDLTLNPDFGCICGYTEQEIKTTFTHHLSKVDWPKLREWYNGFNFLGKEKVYNPFDVLLYLKNKEFKNYWFETATPAFLINLLAKKKYSVPALEHLEASESLLGSFDVESIQLETLLFQTGYLTIADKRLSGARILYTLTYPNLEVKMSLSDYLLNYLMQNNQAKERTLTRVYDALEKQTLDALQDIFHAFFASIPHDWYRKNQLDQYEGYYASIVYCYFTALGLDVTAEDSTNQGRIDLTVKLNQTIYIFEFKVIELDQTPGTALQQIKAKQYHQKHQAADITIYLIGIEFSKDTRNITHFEWEKA